MSDMRKPLAIAIGAALASSFAISSTAYADSSPFMASALSSGYMAASIGDDQKGEEGSCGGDKGDEGSCGGDKGDEGSCGGDKDKGEEGSCGGDKDKGEEGKCGEGKCGGML